MYDRLEVNRRAGLLHWLEFPLRKSPHRIPCQGQYYAQDLTNLLDLRTNDGTNPAVGFEFWQLVDEFSSRRNWGSVTIRENAYDGKEAVIATGTEVWGLPPGGEPGNYGGFLDAVPTANVRIYKVIVS